MSTTTRWWWVRHAPVVGQGGRIYGQNDVDCDCSDGAAFRGLAAAMPEDAVWVTSNLSRTHRTAESIVEHLPDGTAPAPLVEPSLAEQHFGDWQGLTNAELAERRDETWHRFWLAPVSERPPGGESFLELVDRVTATVERLTADHAGRDIVAVTHGGTIRAALVLALGIAPERALSFVIDNCSLTRLDRIDGPPGSHAPEAEHTWRVVAVNAAPGI